jgi:hypothetical protein
MSPAKLFGATILVIGAIVLFSPVFEQASNSIVFDEIVFQTCFKRHGYNLFARWGCRSSLYRLGPVALAAGCAFKKMDLCEISDKIASKREAAPAPSSPQPSPEPDLRKLLEVEPHRRWMLADLISAPQSMKTYRFTTQMRSRSVLIAALEESSATTSSIAALATIL